MKKFLKAKWFIVLMVVLLLCACVVLSLVPGSPVGFIKRPVSAALSPVQSFVRKSGETVSDFWAALTDGMAVRQENQELQNEIADLKYQLTQNEEAAIRYEELKDAFHISDTFSSYDIFGASILSREADEWFSVIRIGVGESDGVVLSEGQSYPVVDVEMNLVGRVIETDTNDSKVLPLLHEGFAVSCKANEVNSASLLVSGDASLKQDGLCMVTDIDENAALAPGTEIVTSGDGGLFPEGIPVGVIVSVDDSNPLDVTATLRPYANIGDLEDVFVMIPYASETDTASGNEDASAPADETTPSETSEVNSDAS